ETCLARAWQCVFAGTYPTHYWQGAAWNVVIPDVEKLPPDQRPKLGYYRVMNDLAKKYRFDRLISGQVKSNAGFSLHNDDDLCIYYVPEECEFLGIRFRKDLPGRMMKGTWIDPKTGNPIETIERKIEKWPAFKTPDFPGFKLLILEVDTKNP
ncbi:MAG: hypothetical protein AAF623_07670, partial [Planctomycetota bacterium]